MIVFDDYLYAGTGNKKGTEIWRCKVSEKGVNPCFLETIFKGEPQKLHVLRMIRDKILSSDPKGIGYIELYYHYSSEIKEICHSYPEIRGETLEVLKQFVPRTILTLNGERKKLDSSMTIELISLLEKYAEAGSPGLRLEVKKVIGELKNGSLPVLLNSGEIKMEEY